MKIIISIIGAGLLAIGPIPATAEDLSVLRERLLKTEETSDTVQVLREIAAWRSDGAPSAEATALLASQLRHLVVPVRKEAARLLGQGQERETAVLKLTENLDDLGRYLDTLGERKSEIRDQKFLVIARGSDRPLKERVARFNDLEKDRQTIEKAMDQEMSVGGILATSLANYVDKDVLKVLKRFYGRVEEECPRHLPPVADALIATDTREATVRVVRSLDHYRKIRKSEIRTEMDLQKAQRIDRLAEERLGVPPPPKEDREISRWGQSLYASLEQLARAHDLPALPLWDEDDFVTNATKWFTENGAKLPSIGG